MNDVSALREREKELRCLYRVGEAVAHREEGIEVVFEQVLAAIPAGWLDPEKTAGRIRFFGRDYVGTGFDERSPIISEPIRLWGVPVGAVDVSRRIENSEPDDPSFLTEESVLLGSIAERLSGFLEWKQTELLGMRVPARPEHWRWREEQARLIASRMDAQRYAVSALFLGGSTQGGAAGPASDIDLYVVFHGDDRQRGELIAWLDGWSRCLAEIAYRRTGYTFETGLLDVHWLSEEPGLWSRGEMQSLALGVG
ncbi:MAG: hypothetical protein H6807_11325 [Planctomycetes bacterium]|nr:hypothetical protein [Planctomycetota bacterium]